MKRINILIFLIAVSITNVSGQSNDPAIPATLRAFISKIHPHTLAGAAPVVTFEKVSDKITRTSLSWTLSDTVKQDDWQVEIIPAFTPDFHWAPHLTPTDDHIIAQHVFRAPALIVASGDKQITIIPDLDMLNQNNLPECYMDLDATRNLLRLGLSKSNVKEHVSFVRAPGSVYHPGKVEFSFYIIMESRKSALQNPWREALWRWPHRPDAGA